MLSLTQVDRVSITTVVDNYVDALRQDEKVARRYSAFVARQMPDLRAEHGLAHYVEVTRGARDGAHRFRLRALRDRDHPQLPGAGPRRLGPSTSSR